MALLSKSRRVLDRMMTKDGLVQFSQPDMEPGLKTELVLREQDWIDFGSPAQVTITIFAGDLLNGEKPTLNVEEPTADPRRDVRRHVSR